MTADIYKILHPVLTPEEAGDEQILAVIDEELARMPVDLPDHIRMSTALLHALQRLNPAE
jgi:hypothetical protein